MEPLGKRSTGIIIATFALMIIGYHFVVTAAASNSTRIHCSGGHFPLTCTSDGQKFVLTAHT